MPGSQESEHLGARRQLRAPDGWSIRTPLVVPSFSSLATKTPLPLVLEVVRGRIAESALISAYDTYYDRGFGPVALGLASLVLVDSGGYEATRNSEIGRTDRPWSPEIYRAAIDEVQRGAAPFGTHLAITSYDHPADRKGIKSQIDAARGMMPTGGVIREILVKPESASPSALLDVPTICANIKALAQFDIIGVTEKELGTSVFARMAGIARLRQALKSAEAEATPIHVFGCLDPITTPLYFLVGADIFDGLSWLRYRFMRGSVAYIATAAAESEGWLTQSDNITSGSAWCSNLSYVGELQAAMRRFLRTRSFAEFSPYESLIERSLQSVLEEVRG